LISDSAYYQSLVDALAVLGKPNVDLVIHALEDEHIIEEGKVDRKRLEPALRSIFGDAAKVFLDSSMNLKAEH